MKNRQVKGGGGKGPSAKGSKGNLGRLKNLGAKPSKGEDRSRQWKFGQNFLIDEGVVQGIIDDVSCTSDDWVIEIGPGHGAITRGLLQKCKSLTAIDIDPIAIQYLQTRKDFEAVDLIQADASKVDLEALLKDKPKPVVVGNLPYNRAAPIMFHWLPKIGSFHSMDIMVQYEVAKRICSKPHHRDFGFLSVVMQNWATATLLRKIGPESFRPRPKVMSATVRLVPLEQPHTTDPDFLPFVQKAFLQKRKTVANSLMAFHAKEKVLETLVQLGIDEKSRAEDLGVEEFVKLFAALRKD